LPTARADGLRGGVLYWDAQFDDARLAIALARTAAAKGALLLNYCAAKELTRRGGEVTGLRCEDTFSGEAFTVQARWWSMPPACGSTTFARRSRWPVAIASMGKPDALPPLVAPSQAYTSWWRTRRFLGRTRHSWCPRPLTARVLLPCPGWARYFGVRPHTPRQELEREPAALREEVDFILRESARFLSVAPTRADILSIWVGLRPLGAARTMPTAAGSAGQTKKISESTPFWWGPVAW
jgi:glycerol-3-phosphate dehydrogenase